MTDRILWTDDYLVYSAKGYLGRVDDCSDGVTAVSRWNMVPKSKRPKNLRDKAVSCVRITTFDGTITHLLVSGDPVALQWAARGTSDGAKLARVIAKELGVKLPPKKKATKKVSSSS